MNSKTRMACMAALLAAFAVACQDRSRQEEQIGMEQQEPSVLPDEREAERGQGDGLSGEQPGDGQEGRGAAGVLDVSEIAKKPEARIGEKVTVKGKIDKLHGERGFELKSSKIGGGEIVVLGKQSVRGMSDDWDDKSVQVEGTLRRVGAATELERELGWSAGPDLEKKLSEEKVVLIADSVQPTEEEKEKGEAKDLREEQKELKEDMREEKQDTEQELREEQKDVQEEMKDVQEKQRELQQK